MTSTSDRSVTRSIVPSQVAPYFTHGSGRSVGMANEGWDEDRERVDADAQYSRALVAAWLLAVVLGTLRGKGACNPTASPDTYSRLNCEPLDN